METAVVAEPGERQSDAVDPRAFGSVDDEADRTGRQGAPEPDRPGLGQMHRLEDGVEPVVVDEVEPAANTVVAGAADEEELGRGRAQHLRDLSNGMPLDAAPIRAQVRVDGDADRQDGCGQSDGYQPTV